MKIFKTDPEVHTSVKNYCKENDIFMQEFIDTALKVLIKKNKHYFMRELMNELSNLLCIKESNCDVVDIVYVDYKYDNFPKFNDEIAPNVSTKRFNLELEKFDDIEHARRFISDDYIKTIRQEAYLNRSIISKELSSFFDFDVSSVNNYGLYNYSKREFVNGLVRRLLTKFSTTSNFIATEGRIGPANFIFINPKYAKYRNLFQVFGTVKTPHLKDDVILKEIGILGGYTIIADNRIAEDEIIMGRFNNPDQPGVLGVWSTKDSNGKEVGFNELYYKTTTIGFFPYKQFMCIKLYNNDTNKS